MPQRNRSAHAHQDVREDRAQVDGHLTMAILFIAIFAALTLAALYALSHA